MKFVLAIMLLASPCFATEWFDISPKPAWRTGPIQTYQNPALGSEYPWEHTDDLVSVSFEVAFSATAGMSGNKYSKLLAFAHRSNSAINKFSNLALPTTPLDITKTYTPVIFLINDYFGLESPSKGDGFQLSMAASAGYSVQNLFQERDALSFRFTKSTFQGWSYVLDKHLNQDLRLMDVSPGQWLYNLQWARSQWPTGYNISPLSPAGFRFANELTDAGYGLEDAAFIAYLLEGSGLDFNSESADTFLSWLTNSLNGEGETLSDGDVLKGNKSGLRSSILSLMEYGVTYSFGINDGPLADLFTFGVTAKYMAASRRNSFDLGSIGSQPSLNPLAFLPDSRSGFGLDLGVIFTPLPEYSMALSLSARNINVPTFKWENETIKLDPQIRAGFSAAPFSNVVPITVGFDLDLNRVESYVIPGYYTQQFRLQLEIDPKLNPANFYLRFGMVQNVGDAGEPVRGQAGFGLKLWWFTLDVMGDSSFDDIARSAEILNGAILPTRFGFSAQFGFKVEW